jgi:molybdopterin-guanine dinucleotide biosynthesis protein A
VGPLAGVLTGLEWARVHAAKARFVATVPGDAPFVARDLVEQLRAARDGAEADIAIACGGGRRHPVFGLWPVRLADALRAALVIDGVRKVESWTEQFRVAYAELAPAPLDPFFNVNDRDDLGTAERQLSHAAAAGPR